MPKLILDKRKLSLTDIYSIANKKDINIQLSESSWNRIREACSFIDKIMLSGERSYGINTSFGDLIVYNIPNNLHAELQKRLVLSHSVGVGEKFSADIVRMIFFLRILYLAKGVSGVREASIKKLLAIYNKGVIPEICLKGSLGASGDLSPLSQFAAFLIGKGFGYLNDKRLPASAIFKKIGIKELLLDRKEGLSLINGTSAMTAVGIKVSIQFNSMIELFIMGMGLIMDSCKFSTSFLQPEAFEFKEYQGSMLFVKKIRSLLMLKGSIDVKQGNLQEVYSIRCVPFIINPAIDSLTYLNKILTIEANSVNDNPIFIKKLNALYHGGHFHGAPVSFALDNARIGISILSNLIDRQLDYILNSKNNIGLPPFLSFSPEEGYTGFAGAQYLVTSLAIENKNEANPYSNQSIPTNGGNQDLVSLGLQSGMAALKMLENLRTIIYIYFLAAMQVYAIKKIKPGNQRLMKMYNKLSDVTAFPYKDDQRFSEVLESLMKENILEGLIDSK